MKPLAYILAIGIIFAAPALSQEKEHAPKPPASQKQPGNDKQTQKETSKPGVAAQQELKGFIDQDGDGIDDRKSAPAQQTQNPSQERKRMGQHMQDQFIDTDGDGINDNRCNGLGFGTTKKKSHRHGGGKK